MIAIIDYNAGNIASVKNALASLGYQSIVTSDPRAILRADKVIFPGQGRAGPAMANLQASGLDKVIKKITAPFLGICLGMQLLLPYSEEDSTRDLGIIPGRARRWPNKKLPIPQMGWNTVTQTGADMLLVDMPDTFYCYFANSYYVDTAPEFTLGTTTYGATVSAAIIKKDNFYGTQFHPEKSGNLGIQVLKNFCELGKTTANKTVLIPAIDIIDGVAVRLRQGDYGRQTAYRSKPLAIAKSLVRAGAQYLHLIDLEGARAGVPRNQKTVLEIARNVSVPVQVGGGIRDFATATQYLDAGVARVILGTAAVNKPETVKKLISRYGPGRVVVAVDGRNGRVATNGWLRTSAKSVLKFLKELRRLGVTTIIYTDVKRDGMLRGPNFRAIAKILRTPLKVIIAGGVTTIKDAERLSALGADGVIIGKAVYEGRFNLKSALKRIKSPPIIRPLPAPANATTKRIIACLDIANGRVVKGVKFKNVRAVGDPVALAKQYSAAGVDELVFLDIMATIENRATLYRLVERIAKNINIPFTVGGGIKTFEDIRSLLIAGADKVSIGSTAITNPEFVRTAAREFGSQCIVISVDPKWNGKNWELYINGGREATGVDVIKFCQRMQRLGAGELLVNSLDRDGTKRGYDLALLKKITTAVNIPVIASSGAGKKADFLAVLKKTDVSAVLAASLFHSGKLAVPELKNYLQKNNINVRI